MLRGHIDNVGKDNVSGWIYSSQRRVTGERVLAFSGLNCIGVGEIGTYRDDLKEAGLDDGKLGFQIFFDPQSVVDAKTVHVRMEDSDFSLVTKEFWDFRLIDPKDQLGLFSQPEIDRVNWMASQGWLNQSQFALAKAINTMGVYQRTMSRADLESSTIEMLVRDVYVDCISILLKVAQKIVRQRLVVENFSGDISGFTSTAPCIVALYGAPFSCEVYEGRHRIDLERGGSVMPIHYDNSIYQVMFLHVDCCDSVVGVQEGNIQIIRLAPS